MDQLLSALPGAIPSHPIPTHDEGNSGQPHLTSPAPPKGHQNFHPSNSSPPFYLFFPLHLLFDSTAHCKHSQKFQFLCKHEPPILVPSHPRLLATPPPLAPNEAIGPPKTTSPPRSQPKRRKLSIILALLTNNLHLFQQTSLPSTTINCKYGCSRYPQPQDRCYRR